jgi:2-polyprenyl-3-methyl-5-hydroxy-6-metoxy-1,4-benzoquinol methylase
MAAEEGWSAFLRFQTIDSLAQAPDLAYDVVSIVDVVHHVRRPDQLDFFIEAASKLRRGGTLIYKDISAQHKFWGACNTLHDLLKAQELVHYVSEESLGRAARAAGLERCTSSYVRKLWYMHVIQIFHKLDLHDSWAKRTHAGA